MRRALILVPVLLSALVLGAHVLRWGQLWLAVATAALPLLLLTGRRWAVVTLQVALAAGALEWLRTLGALVATRRELGLPYSRLAVILGGVALVTAGAAALLAWWRPGREPAAPQPAAAAVEAAS